MRTTPSKQAVREPGTFLSKPINFLVTEVLPVPELPDVSVSESFGFLSNSSIDSMEEDDRFFENSQQEVAHQIARLERNSLRKALQEQEDEFIGYKKQFSDFRKESAATVSKLQIELEAKSEELKKMQVEVDSAIAREEEKKKEYTEVSIQVTELTSRLSEVESDLSLLRNTNKEQEKVLQTVFFSSNPLDVILLTIIEFKPHRYDK